MRNQEGESPIRVGCMPEQGTERDVPTTTLEKEATLPIVAVPTTTSSSSGTTTAMHKLDHSAQLESEQQKHRTKRVRSWYAHMALIALAEFSAEAARGLVLPTLFTYSQELGGDLVFMGLLTSLFSLGRFVSSLLFGWLSDRMSFRALYNLASVVSIVGNVLYILPYTPSIRSKALLGVSRCVVGFGAGNRSVCRANIAQLTNVHERLEYFTLFATVVFLAYALTPGLGGVFGNLHVAVAGELLELNRFTAPGFVLVVLNVVTLAVNNLVFDESISRADAPGATLSSSSSTLNKTERGELMTCASAPAPLLSDRMVALGAGVFLFLNFNTRGMLSVFETVNVPLFLQVTHRTSSIEVEEAVSATEAASSFYFVVGLLGLVSYATLQLLGKRVSDVTFLLFGFVTLLIGNALLVWLCTLLPPVAVASMPSTPSNDRLFDLFVVAEVFVWSIGCPLTSAVVVSAFSKVLGTRPQGLFMGLFGSSASIARMLMPFLPGLLASWEALFAVNVVLCSTCVAVLVVYVWLAHRSATCDTTRRQQRSGSYESVENPVVTPTPLPHASSPISAP